MGSKAWAHLSSLLCAPARGDHSGHQPGTSSHGQALQQGGLRRQHCVMAPAVTCQGRIHSEMDDVVQLHAAQANGRHLDARQGAVATPSPLHEVVASGAVLSVDCALHAANVTALSNRCWTLCKAVLGKIKAAASLLHHLDRSDLLLLQAFHDRAPLVLLSKGKQAEAERSGMLRARYEHEMCSMLHAHAVEAG